MLKTFTNQKSLALGLALALTAVSCSSEDPKLTGDLGESPAEAVDTEPTETAPTATTTTSSSTTASSPAASAPVSLTQTDLKKIVSYGEGLDFNGQTGGPNDIALHPTTKLPAIAYYDKSLAAAGTTTIGALKFAQFDNSGNWDIQVVDANFGTAACGSAGANCIGAPNALTDGANIAQIIQLKFKSTGMAVIAYVYGASAAASKVVRIAEQTASDAWTISQVDYSGYANVNTTYDPIKAVTLTLDSSDRLHVTFAFYHSTDTSSQLVYAFRSAAGVWTSYDAASLVTGGALELGGGLNQANGAFCPLDGSFLTTSSVITGAGTSTANLHKCAVNGSGLCPNLASWSTVDMAAALTLGANPGGVAAGIGGGRSAVLITSDNKVIIGSTDDTNGINFAISNETCSTAVGAMTWTAAAAQINTANAGVTGFKAALTPSNLVVFAGVATTSFIMTKMSADLTTGFAAGTTITAETITAGNDGVGLVYDSTNDLLYASYAALPAAVGGDVGNDIKVAFGYPSDVVDTGAQLAINVVDQTTSMFASTSVPVLHAAKAPNGTVGYTYFYRDSGATPSPTSRLYYGVKGGTTAAPFFAANLVQNFSDSAAASTDFVGQYPSLAYDSSSNPVISYVDANAGTNGYLMVARSKNQGLSFNLDWVDGAGATTVGRFSSTAVYGDVIGVSYYDYTPANTGLKFARWKPGSGWRKYVVDGMTGATGTGCSTIEDAGSFSQFKWTSDGRPVIFYQSNPSAVKNLKVAYATESTTSATYTWTCVTLDAHANTRGEGIEFVLDSNDKPHVAYFDLTAAAVRYATCASAVGTCVASGSSAWSTERVGLVTNVTSVASRPSIQVDSSGKRFVSYYSNADTALVIATKSTTDTLWAYETIDSGNVTGGTYQSAAGQHGVLLLNSNELPMVFYRSIENWLKFFSREML